MGAVTLDNNFHLVGDFWDRQNLLSFCSVAGSRQMAGQQKSNMAAQEGTNDNTGDILYKKLQHKVHEIKVYELKQFF